jgi:hypothetical protein
MPIRHSRFDRHQSYREAAIYPSLLNPFAERLPAW